MMEEIWKDIEGYEGVYQVSNLGRVRSLDRIVECVTNGKPRTFRVKGVVMKQHQRKDKYMCIVFWIANKPKTFLIHRLVAEAFISNPDNFPMINHKDEDKTNNHVDNLEWCTNQYNLTYKNAQHRAKATMRKAVVQMTLDGKFVAEYESTHDAARKTGFHQGNIAGACRGQHNLLNVYGFHWKYKEE